MFVPFRAACLLSTPSPCSQSQREREEEIAFICSAAGHRDKKKQATSLHETICTRHVQQLAGDVNLKKRLDYAVQPTI